MVSIREPISGGDPYMAECYDIIQALNMDFNEGEAFKAIWRKAAARKGNTKDGATALYNAEKVVFFGEGMLLKEKRRKSHTDFGELTDEMRELWEKGHCKKSNNK